MNIKKREMLSRLSKLGFDPEIKREAEKYFNGSLHGDDFARIKKLIEFVATVLDESLFLKNKKAL